MLMDLSNNITSITLSWQYLLQPGPIEIGCFVAILGDIPWSGRMEESHWTW